MSEIDARIQRIYVQVVKKNPGEVEFHRAVKEVVETLGPVLRRHPEYMEHKVIERICEPGAVTGQHESGRTALLYGQPRHGRA